MNTLGTVYLKKYEDDAGWLFLGPLERGHCGPDLQGTFSVGASSSFGLYLGDYSALLAPHLLFLSAVPK